MTEYFRPIVQTDAARPTSALVLADGWGWFTHCERLSRSQPEHIVPVDDVPDHWIARLTSERSPIAGMSFDRPRLMGILNVTPDSFSDGGRHNSTQAATERAGALVNQGADIIDIGGESTRPGAQLVPVDEEIQRVVPTITAMRAQGLKVPVSVDTRKAQVARAACDAGADLVNDVSGFTFDADLGPLAADMQVPVCVMHAQGTPQTMQNNPTYDDVVLDVFDWLDARIGYLVSIGVPRSRIIADVGIGFGKTQDHNLALLKRLSLFHGLGVTLLLGVSRKRLIGQIADVADAAQRGPGSVALALGGLAQGVQMIRAHDVADHAQAIALWQATVA